MNIINTFRCNFTCAHCCFSCSPGKTGYLDNNQLIRFVREYGDGCYVNLIGGEPFLHPDILWQLEFLSWNFEYVRVVTNGSWILTKSGNHTKKFKAFLEKLWELDQSKIHMMISDDPYHRQFHVHEISDLVRQLERNTDMELEYDKHLGQRTVIPIGRAKRNGLSHLYYNSDAFCQQDSIPDWTILPDGSISACCNARCILGNVHNSVEELEIRYEAMVRQNRGKRLTDCGNCPRVFKQVVSTSEPVNSDQMVLEFDEIF